MGQSMLRVTQQVRQKGEGLWRIRADTDQSGWKADNGRRCPGGFIVPVLWGCGWGGCGGGAGTAALQALPEDRADCEVNKSVSTTVWEK